MKEIEALIKAENELAKSSLIYQLIGHFGDRLPKDVQEEMRKQAENLYDNRNKLRKKVQVSCK